MNTQGWKNLNFHLRKLRGWAAVQDLRRLENLYKKQIQTKNNIIFLRRCQKNALIPKGLKMQNQFLRFNINSKEMLRFVLNTEQKILKAMKISEILN